MEKLQEMFNKDLEEKKNKQTVMNNTINEIKKYTRNNSRRMKREEWISELEDRMMEITTKEQNKEQRMKRNEDSNKDLWDNVKNTNI